MWSGRSRTTYVGRSSFPMTRFFHLQWNLMQVGMERAWDINLGATDAVTVAVIDSGLAFEDAVIEYEADEFRLNGLDYPALGRVDAPFAAAFDLIGPNRIDQPFDFVWMDDHPVDMSGHGTHVTGTLGQLTNNAEGVSGVAFNVRIMPLKVLARRVGLHLRRHPGVLRGRRLGCRRGGSICGGAWRRRDQYESGRFRIRRQSSTMPSGSRWSATSSWSSRRQFIR